MMQIRLFIFICLVTNFPQTSNQDAAIDPPVRRRSSPTTKINANSHEPIESLMRWLSEQQYQYETAHYALALTNVFPNFAKFFRERSKEKYDDIKGLIRLSQVLNLDIQLRYILPNNIINRPLRLLAPEIINKTNLVQFINDIKRGECETTFTQLISAHQMPINMAVPLQMYLKAKLFIDQVLVCKSISDLSAQLDRLVDVDDPSPKMPFALMFADARAQILSA